MEKGLAATQTLPIRVESITFKIKKKGRYLKMVPQEVITFKKLYGQQVWSTNEHSQRLGLNDK